MQRKQMGPVDVNGGVHTALKQHQRICVRICARASSVDWALGLRDAVQKILTTVAKEGVHTEC